MYIEQKNTGGNTVVKKLLNSAQIITFLRQNLVSSIVVLALALAAGKLLGLYTSVDADDGHWQQFKVEHECVLQTGAQGSQRLSWKCNDGQVYFSWRQQR